MDVSAANMDLLSLIRQYRPDFSWAHDKQQPLVEHLFRRESDKASGGLVCAGPGFGKTDMYCILFALRPLHTIVVTTKGTVGQVVETASKYLGEQRVLRIDLGSAEESACRIRTAAGSHPEGIVVVAYFNQMEAIVDMQEKGQIEAFQRVVAGKL
jgi:hypothetical protein